MPSNSVDHWLLDQNNNPSMARILTPTAALTGFEFTQAQPMTDSAHHVALELLGGGDHPSVVPQSAAH